MLFINCIGHVFSQSTLLHGLPHTMPPLQARTNKIRLACDEALDHRKTDSFLLRAALSSRNKTKTVTFSPPESKTMKGFSFPLVHVSSPQFTITLPRKNPEWPPNWSSLMSKTRRLVWWEAISGIAEALALLHPLEIAGAVALDQGSVEAINSLARRLLLRHHLLRLGGSQR